MTHILIVPATDSGVVYDEHGSAKDTLRGVAREEFDRADIVIGFMPGGPLRVMKGDATATLASSYGTGTGYADSADTYEQGQRTYPPPGRQPTR